MTVIINIIIIYVINKHTQSENISYSHWVGLWETSRHLDLELKKQQSPIVFNHNLYHAFWFTKHIHCLICTLWQSVRQTEQLNKYYYTALPHSQKSSSERLCHSSRSHRKLDKTKTRMEVFWFCVECSFHHFLLYLN